MAENAQTVVEQKPAYQITLMTQEKFQEELKRITEYTIASEYKPLEPVYEIEMKRINDSIPEIQKEFQELSSVKKALKTEFDEIKKEEEELKIEEQMFLGKQENLKKELAQATYEVKHSASEGNGKYSDKQSNLELREANIKETLETMEKELKAKQLKHSLREQNAQLHQALAEAKSNFVETWLKPIKKDEKEQYLEKFDALVMVLEASYALQINKLELEKEELQKETDKIQSERSSFIQRAGKYKRTEKDEKEYTAALDNFQMQKKKVGTAMVSNDNDIKSLKDIIKHLKTEKRKEIEHNLTPEMIAKHHSESVEYQRQQAKLYSISLDKQIEQQTNKRYETDKQQVKKTNETNKQQVKKTNETDKPRVKKIMPKTKLDPILKNEVAGENSTQKSNQLKLTGPKTKLDQISGEARDQNKSATQESNQLDLTEPLKTLDQILKNKLAEEILTQEPSDIGSYSNSQRFARNESMVVNFSKQLSKIE